MRHLFQQCKFAKCTTKCDTLCWTPSLSPKIFVVRTKENSSMSDIRKGIVALTINGRTSICMGVFVTGLTQLKLVKNLRRVGNRPLYRDTDSVMSVSTPREPDSLVRSILCDLEENISMNFRTLERSYTTGERKVRNNVTNLKVTPKQKLEGKIK